MSVQELISGHRSYRPMVWTGYAWFKGARQNALKVKKKKGKVKEKSSITLSFLIT